jgi:hypothetical protein
MKIIPIILFIFSFLNSFEFMAQETDSAVTFEYKIVETTPEPKGGYEAIFNWFYNNLDVSSLTGLDTLDCQSGKNRVLVSFVIDETGQLTEPEIAKGIGNPYDKYCLELVNRMPIRWTPGTFGGKAVKVKSALPFKFCQRKEQSAQTNRKNRKKG